MEGFLGQVYLQKANGETISLFSDSDLKVLDDDKDTLIKDTYLPSVIEWKVEIRNSHRIRKFINRMCNKKRTKLTYKTIHKQRAKRNK